MKVENVDNLTSSGFTKEKDELGMNKYVMYSPFVKHHIIMVVDHFGECSWDNEMLKPEEVDYRYELVIEMTKKGCFDEQNQLSKL